MAEPYIPPHLQPAERAGLEPGVPPLPASDAASLHSIAISLKRIADTLESLIPKQVVIPADLPAELLDSLRDRPFAIGEQGNIMPFRPIGEPASRVMDALKRAAIDEAADRIAAREKSPRAVDLTGLEERD